MLERTRRRSSWPTTTAAAPASCTRRGQYDQAADECRAALRQWEDYPLAHGYLGQSELALGRYPEAARAFDLYLEKGGPPLPDVFRGRGQARMKLGDYLGARDDYTRVVLEQPGAEIYEHRGWAYFFADAWQPALRDFDDALRLDPARGDAYTGRALARVMLGRYREAVTRCRRGAERKPSAPEMMHNLACVFAQAAARAEADTAAPDRLAAPPATASRAVARRPPDAALRPRRTGARRSSARASCRTVRSTRSATAPAFRELLRGVPVGRRGKVSAAGESALFSIFSEPRAGADAVHWERPGSRLFFSIFLSAPARSAI